MTESTTQDNALNKLEHLLSDFVAPTQKEQLMGKKEPPDFNEEEIETLRRVIYLVQGLEALGSFASFLKTTIIWFGVVIGAFIAIKNGAIEFILDSVNGTRG